MNVRGFDYDWNVTEFLGFVKYSFTHKVLLFHWLFFGHFVLTLNYKHTTNARAIGFISVLVVSLNFFFFFEKLKQNSVHSLQLAIEVDSVQKVLYFFFFIYLFIYSYGYNGRSCI